MKYLFLSNVKVYGSHGAYADEERLGNSFIIDIKLYGDFEKAEKSDNLQDTVDYETVFEIIKEEAAIPARLLEHLAFRMIDRLSLIPKIHGVVLKIQKNNPPVKGEVGSSGYFMEVDFTKQRNSRT